MSTTVYLITKSGPEWQKPIEVWPTKKKAEARVKELDAELDQKNVFDRLSAHEVVAVPMKGQP
jgi:hypothetical protein